MTRLVDTNVLLRLLTSDDAVQAAACRRLIERAMRGDESLAVNCLVIAELVWTLESYFGLSPSAIREKIDLLLNTPGIKVEQREVIAQAVALYEEKNVDYIDAFNAVYCRDRGFDGIYSYDRYFDRLAVVARVKP